MAHHIAEEIDVSVIGEVRDPFPLPHHLGSPLATWQATVTAANALPAAVTLEIPSGRIPTPQQFLTAFLHRSAREYAARNRAGN